MLLNAAVNPDVPGAYPKAPAYAVAGDIRALAPDSPLSIAARPIELAMFLVAGSVALPPVIVMADSIYLRAFSTVEFNSSAISSAVPCTSVP